MRWSFDSGLPRHGRGSRRAFYGFVVAAAALSTGFASAEEPAPPASGPAPGHSLHGETFSEGPRQQAHLIAGTGDVHFPATSSHPQVQAFIDQGVGQLHGYWFFEAERSFRQAASFDPDCAIAYWGMAMANTNNEERARGFITEADKRKEKASPRERAYIESLKAFYNRDREKEGDYNESRRKALVKAYERIVDEYPDDLEAKALLIGQIYDNHGGGVPITAFFPVDALIKEVLAVNPKHPVHHYRIHLWDFEKPERGLSAAANCGPAAPGIAHMWHMPGHIYSRLKRYRDACWQQEASARVDHASMIEARILPDQIHNYAHNNEWFTRNLICVGRMHDARRMAIGLIENPQHPKFNTITQDGSFKYGRARLRDVLSDFELWDDIIGLADTTWLEPTANEEEQVERLRLLARARFRRGDFAEGCALLMECQTRRTAIRAERETAMAEAAEKSRKDGKSDKEVDEARDHARKQFNGRLNPWDQAIAELRGYVHVADGAFSDALKEFKNAGRFDSAYLASVQLRAGKKDEAIKTARQAVRSHENEVLPLGHLVEMLWNAGERNDAKKEFESLRSVAADFDVEAPLFHRLSEIAVQCEWPADWRQRPPVPGDLGERPPLESLGPFAWRPSPAVRWTLPDESGRLRMAEEFSGRPQIVLFSLGMGCLHCNEQLKVFAAAHKRFEDAGLSVIAISSDSVENLQVSMKQWRKDAPADSSEPLLLLSDQPLAAFHAFRCYDDFEKFALHGTFLIDANGLVRWQDIGPEPFTNIDFLLEESKRLLSFSVEPGPSHSDSPPPPPVAYPMPQSEARLSAQVRGDAPAAAE